MFVILSYDIGEKRAEKASRIVKKYLSAKQRSLYQGFLTAKQLSRLKNELYSCLDPAHDTVSIYKVDDVSGLYIDEIGTAQQHNYHII